MSPANFVAYTSAVAALVAVGISVTVVRTSMAAAISAMVAALAALISGAASVHNFHVGMTDEGMINIFSVAALLAGVATSRVLAVTRRDAELKAILRRASNLG